MDKTSPAYEHDTDSYLALMTVCLNLCWHFLNGKVGTLIPTFMKLQQGSNEVNYCVLKMHEKATEG